MEAVILAGGQGTRLKSLIPDLPKPMAPVAGQPFLAHLMRYIAQFGIRHVVLSVGYGARVIMEYFGKEWEQIQISYAQEEVPLGTGGGIRNALMLCKSEQVLIFNGDSLFHLDVGAFMADHLRKQAEFSMTLKIVDKPDRYGTVVMENGRICQFIEKKPGLVHGLINTGVYALNRNRFLDAMKQKAFSFEQDFLAVYVNQWNFNGFRSEGYFIDIGIPEDYIRARACLALPQSLTGWTLFLDRDGVINKRKENDYIRNVEEFEFLPGVLGALKIAAHIFGRIFVVTNQQGIGKGLMSREDLDVIHRFMRNTIEENGGRIDAVYDCPALASANDPCRKPGPGMGYQAKQDFPEISFEKAIMIGDAQSDLEFANNLGIRSVYITEHPYKYELNLTDIQTTNLAEIMSYLKDVNSAKVPWKQIEGMS